MKRFEYHRPESLGEAWGLMEKLQGNAKYVAGGTDVIVRIKQRVIGPEALISLRRIGTLAGISRKGSLFLGSMTRFRDLERDATLAREYPALAEAASWVANPQVRNVATLGGNLCNAAPSADAAPPLLVLGAVLSVEGPGGKREIPLERFFVGPGQTCLHPTEVLTGISVPAGIPGASAHS